MSRIKRISLTIMASLGLLIPVAVPTIAFAAENDATSQGLCQGANLQFGTSSNCENDTGSAEGTVNKIITNVINIFSIVVGVVAVIMIIVGGLKYITSGGDSGNVTGAKNTILYAIIGLVIVALAQVIVRFVLAKSAPIVNAG